MSTDERFLLPFSSGFSVPVTCMCQDARVVTGCTKNLWALGRCDGDGQRDNGVGGCWNPRRDQAKIQSPASFFAPCQHMAYTYVEDHAANANGWCTGDTITCCIGERCPKHPGE